MSQREICIFSVEWNLLLTVYRWGSEKHQLLKLKFQTKELILEGEGGVGNEEAWEERRLESPAETSLLYTLQSSQGETWSIITSKKRKIIKIVLQIKLRRQNSRSITQEPAKHAIPTRHQLHAADTEPVPRKPLTFLRVSPGGCSGVEKLIVGILLLAEDTPTFRPAIITLRTTVNNRIHLSHTALHTTQSRSETDAASRDLHMNVSLVHSYRPGHTCTYHQHTVTVHMAVSEHCTWWTKSHFPFPLFFNSHSGQATNYHATTHPCSQAHVFFKFL